MRKPIFKLGIKTKIFLPLFLLMAGVGLYFYLVWVPKSVSFSVGESLKLLHHTLEIVEIQITQDIAKGDLDTVRQNLDLLLLKNPSWQRLVLKDANGVILYPEGEEILPSTRQDLKAVSLQMATYGKNIGSLTLEYDFSETSKEIRRDALRLFAFLIGALFLFIATATIIIQLFVIKPARLLAKAAEHFTSGDTAGENDIHHLPPVTSDEIGTLTQSFTAMRKAIALQRLNLVSQNKELEAARDLAERSNRAKSEFLANMSHELRTPLNSIMGLSRMISEEPSTDQDTAHMATTVNKAAITLLDIVNDILDISKIEAGGMVLEKIGFDIKEIISSIVETMAPIASGKGVSLKYHYETEDIPFVLGDPLRFSRIVTNLVSNAIKYTETGEVNISVAADPIEGTDNSQIEFYCTVEDTGIGIPQDKLHSIFDKFTQVDETITRRFGGTGLGLAITQDLVKMMHGTIGIDSVVGQGSLAWFKIPFIVTDEIDKDMRRGRRAQRQKVVSADHLIPAEQARLLVAEDHQLNQDFIKRLLKRMDLQNYLIVETGADAVDKWRDGNFSLILMDCHMPEKNGYEATRDIRAAESGTGKRIPIIALTADAMKGTQEKCIDAGMDEYITKPIDADDLRDALSQWILFPDTTVSAPAQPQGIVEPVDTPADLSLLSDYAETPEEMEQFLQTFTTVSTECLELLTAHCIDGICTPWVEAAHKFKGGAGIVGAKKLQALCAQAQDMEEASIKDRENILKKIKNEYDIVKKYCEQEIAN